MAIGFQAENNIITPAERTARREVGPVYACENVLKSLGVFKITYYWTGEPGVGTITKTGTTVQAGRTIATDPRVIPLGSKVVINGIEYVAEDIGGAIKGNIIDIYVEAPNSPNSYGIDYEEVFVYR